MRIGEQIEDEKRLYNVTFDGEILEQIWLPEFTTQPRRDIARRKIALEYGIPTHYLRLKRALYKTQKGNIKCL